MSKNMVYGAEKTTALRSDYLTATIIRQETLARWKSLEKRRSFLGVLMIVAAITGAVAALAVWLPYRTVPTNPRGYLYAGIALAAGLLLCAAFGIFRAVTTAAARRVYPECYTAELAVEECADAIKAATLDPVLNNAIVISVRSVITAAPYEYTEEATDSETEPAQSVPKYRKSAKTNGDGYEVFKGPVSSAIVFIDGVEIGALDLNRDFSIFRVSPGTHTVKVKIRKNYSAGRELTLETTPSTLLVNNNYRVQLYTVDARLQNGKLTYALKLAEYDDITTFRRDAMDTDRLEKLEQEAELDAHLTRRAERLYRELHEQARYKELFRDQESRRYERQKYRWISKKDSPLDSSLVREYRKKANAIAKKILILQSDPEASEKAKEKKLRALDEELTLLARELYKKLNVNNEVAMMGLQEAKLKNILLLGQENVHYEDIARQIRYEASINA